MKGKDHTIKIQRVPKTARYIAGCTPVSSKSCFSIKGFVFLFVLCFLSLSVMAVNKLSIPILEIGAGKEASVPISLSNDSQIVAVQFRLILPEGFILSDTSHLSLTDRKSNHTVSIKRMNKNEYLVVLYSITNSPLRGNSGVLFRMPVLVPDTCQTGRIFRFRFSEIILSARNGINLESSSDPGGLSIIDMPRPDISVENISANSGDLIPGQSTIISWTVKNKGDLRTSAGWSEQVFLVSDNGESAPLGTVYYDQMLEVGGVVSRQATFNLSQTIGIDGNVRIQVKAVPYKGMGELPASQLNNVAVSENTVSVKRLLMLSLSKDALGEKDPNPVWARISRSGSRLTEQVFQIQTNNASRLKVPPTVNIPVGSSGGLFYVNSIDNPYVSLDTIILVTVSGNGYEPATDSLVLVDDELPSFHIVPSKKILNEGESFTLRVARDLVRGDSVKVRLSVDVPGRLNFPNEVLIPANDSSVTVNVTTTDDAIPSRKVQPLFTASASGFNSGYATIDLLDNDMPALVMELTPGSVSESAGYQAVVGIVKRQGSTANSLTIKLTDNANGSMYYSSQTITFEKGASQKQFTIGIVDNDLVDGTRKYTVQAAVYLSGCGCTATSEEGGLVQSELTVLDDDGPALKLTTSQTMLPEGKTDAAYLTLARNTATTENLKVSLSCDRPNDLSLDTAVIIPVGSSFIRIPVTALKNDSIEGDRTAIVSATAGGFTKGVCWLMITDQTLADATVQISSLSSTVAIAKTTVSAKILVRNEGVVKLPSYQSLDIYYASDSTNHSISSKNLLTTFYTSKDILPGTAEQFSSEVMLPDLTGRYFLFAVVNAGQSTRELSYLNNTSSSAGIQIQAPYTAVIHSEVSVYQPGEQVQMSGQLTARGSSSIAGVPVEIYVINNQDRQKMDATTDASGVFHLNYVPGAGQIGHFEIGACYPGEGLKTEQDAFDIYGLRRTTFANIVWEVLVDEDNTGEVELINPGNLALTNLKTVVTSDTIGYSLWFEPVPYVAGGSKTLLKYHLKAKTPSTGNDWGRIKFQVKSDEGAALELSAYYYARTAKASLYSSVPSIQTTMCKGVVRNYTFTITNKGKGASGPISVLIPKLSWLSLVTPAAIPSLSSGESATITLQFAPGDDLIVNMPITGIIGINCENGTGIPVYFRIETVSEQTGGLIVDVCDEYTYYTAEAPHLANASVVIKHPYTQAIIAQGITDQNGIYSADSLPEGYYTLVVTAKQHDTYTNHILIDPGKTNKMLINLSFQAITYTWNVVETEIQDEYTLETTVKFETNVPTPVLVTESPDKIDAASIPVGQSIIYNITVTNKGLITAKDVNITLPSGFNTLTFEALSETHFDLKPQSSVVIPVKVTKVGSTPSSVVALRSAASATGLTDACSATTITIYYWDCGLDRKWHEYGKDMQVYSCSFPSSSGSYPTDGGGGGSWGGGLAFPGGGIGGTNYTPLIEIPSPEITDKGCEPCQNRFLYKMTKCLLKRVPIIGKVLEYVETIQQVQRWVNGELVWEDILVFAPEWVEKIIGYRDLYEDCLKPMFEECVPGDLEGEPDVQLSAPKRVKLRATSAMPDYVVHYQEVLREIYNMMNASENERYELFADSAWMNLTWNEMNVFWEKLIQIEGKVDSSAVYPYKPLNITNEQLMRFLDRWNNSRLNISSDNVIDQNYMKACRDTIQMTVDYAKRLGYNTVSEMFTKETEIYQKEADLGSNSVCATITLKFSQTMTMTRQAFRGTLTVYNGSETEAMKNVSLNLVIEDSNGNQVGAHQFQVNTESLDKLTAIDGTGRIEPKETGSATILFIPTKYAAPVIPQEYSFGGTLSYLDPFTGATVVRDLFPVTLTVKPSPDLVLNYFMQRDVLGDDALTPDVVESMEPAEFSLLIHNQGAGDATKVNISSKQPEIVENEKGLLVNFEIISSSLNGAESSIGCTDIDFGTIPAGKCAFGQWWFTSTLLGHFVDYDVKMTHVTSYDNPDLSLVSEVSIHELIRSIRADSASQERTGFLVNDLRDTEDLPDILYLSDGTTRNVGQITNAVFNKLSDNVYSMTVTPAGKGWNYGSFEDPVLGTQKLLSVSRQDDNKTLPLRNIWQTDRTLRDGREPLNEFRIHLADEINTNSATYLLTFEPRRYNILEIKSFDSIPEKVSSTQVDRVLVKFNKPIIDSTFTKEDLSLNCQGVPVSLDSVTISSLDSVTYIINLSDATRRNGYFALTAQTKSIQDTEGYSGAYGKSAAWNQYLSGKVEITLKIQPNLSGKVTPDSILYTYGTTVRFKAQSKSGYRFMNWVSDEKTLSTDSVLTYVVNEPKTIVANFEPLYCDFTLQYDATNGSITGGKTGVYTFGTTLKLIAQPGLHYRFAGWKVNGVMSTDKDTLEIKLLEKNTVQALFTSTLFTIKHSFGQGWNWISSNFTDASIRNPKQFLSPILFRTVKMLGFDQELVVDPIYGLTGGLTDLSAAESYKLKVNSSCVLTQTGSPSPFSGVDIQLAKGWNWIGYLPSVPLTPSVALADAHPQTDEVIKNQTDFSIYSGSDWVGTLDTMKTGEGYIYLANASRTFRYQGAEPASVPAAVALRSAVAMVDGWIFNTRQFPDNMNLIARLLLKEVVADPEEYVLAAFVGEECRGIGKPVKGLSFMTLYGQQDEAVLFKVLEKSTGKIMAVNETMPFGDNLFGSLQQPKILNIGSEMTDLETRNRGLVLYPNPVRDWLYLSSSQPIVKSVQIYQSDGKLLSLYEGEEYMKGINVSNLPAGMYFVKLLTSNGLYCQRFIKLGDN